jgi:hypothetical protein
MSVTSVFARPSYVVLLLCQLSMPHAAEIDLSGTVVDDVMKPIAEAELYLYARRHLATRSDVLGRFRLTGNPEKISIVRRGNHSPRIDYGVTAIDPASAVEKVWLYDINGRKIRELQPGSLVSGIGKNGRPDPALAAGVYLVVSKFSGRSYVAEVVVSEGGLYTANRSVAGEIHPEEYHVAQTDVFSDILIVSSAGTQTLRRAVTSLQESDILLQLMPSGAGNVTPGIPVFTDSGGAGDVTTYGSVSDPEFSQGGACNYGSTGIRYYAAINVNQLPGDLQGQWQDGRSCGRCARVSVRTKEGAVRTTTVRIVDRCADVHCGIDLGGAPAGVLMGTQPGRYSGEWEWVSCDGVDGVSDGPPSLHVKEGSGTWWSLVQVRNGPDAVAQMRVRKAGDTQWQSLPWATEAENYFKLPVELLQDDNDWEVEVVWQTGSSASLLLQGSKFAVADATYPLQ